MSLTRRSAKKQAKNRQRRRRTAHERLARDRRQAQHAAVRALAFTWIRILSRCWQERTPYDESVYLQALKRRNAPLLPKLANLS